MKDKSNIIERIIFTLCIFSVVITLIICNIRDNIQYQQTLENPLTKRQIEEDLEEVFLTKDIYVYSNINYEKEAIYCTVHANGFYYRVRYIISDAFLDHAWKFDRYEQVSSEIIKYYV